ncbi:MAG: archease [Candidatus Niyogibacteria bacterium]|nr:archease [Candidatus Niyogibacteria bacterium]
MEIMGFIILPHTADLRMRVDGLSLQELFLGAFEGMMRVLKERKPSREAAKIFKRRIKISSADASALLVDFLNEVLYNAYSHKEIYLSVAFKNISNTELEAEIFGVPVEDFDEDIKATTYHEADIKKNKSGKWETVLVFDI